MVGIDWRDTDAFIDEIPGAYKDIDLVMDDAADLVEIKPHCGRSSTSRASSHHAEEQDPGPRAARLRAVTWAPRPNRSS